MISVGPSGGAMAAVQKLAAVNRDLLSTAQIVSSGTRISSVKENSAVWITANRMAPNLKVFDILSTMTDRAASILDTAITSGEFMMDIVHQMKDKALAATQAGLTPESRSAIWSEFNQLTSQLQSTMSSAQFDAQNLWDGTWATALNEIDSVDGIGIPGDSVGFAANVAQLPTIVAANATNNPQYILEWTRTVLEADLSRLLARWGGAAKRLEVQSNSLDRFSNTLLSSLGKIRDADLSKENAKLKSLQVSQQLATEGLSIANRAGQAALSLFR
jgi:flagellin